MTQSNMISTLTTTSLSPKYNYITIGRRCNTTDLLLKYNLRGPNSPFEWIYCDFETSLYNISNGFKDFTNDIVLIDDRLLKPRLYYSKNTTEPNKNFFSQFKGLHYMGESYYGIPLKINQNYLPSHFSSNIYEWDRLCIFHHIDIHTQKGLETIKRRIERFNTMKEKHLLYMTEILHEKKDKFYMDIVHKYNIELPITIIMCIDKPIETTIRKEENVIFIYKSVPIYEYQASFGKLTDNNIDIINFDDVVRCLK